VKALFKGLGPNIVGVAPYRAIYFFSYATSKNLLASPLGADKPIMHVMAAFMAGFTAVSITNPIWFVKTRLQLDESRRGLTALGCAQKILKEKGVLGFYKGISASYFGICESAMYFVIYERLKQVSKDNLNGASQNLAMLSYFTSAGFAKSLASCICYPHGNFNHKIRKKSHFLGYLEILFSTIR
jgi:solute carrier family 25 protein 33/36